MPGSMYSIPVDTIIYHGCDKVSSIRQSTTNIP